MVRLGGGGGAWTGGPKLVFLNGHVVFQIDEMQVKFSPQGQTGILGVRSKGQISVNFNYKVNFNDFYTKDWLYSQK